MLYGVYAAVLVLLGIAVYTDIQTRKIKNGLILAVLGLAIVNGYIDSQNVHNYFLSALIGAVIWLGLFYGNVVGGGDAKLMIALSALVLPVHLFLFYACVLGVGGLQAVWWLLVKKTQTMPYAVSIAIGSFYFVLLV